MKLSVSLFTTSALAIAASLVQAQSDSANSTDYYPLTTIVSQNDFCLFLPPQPGLEVAINEDNGIPFCFKEDRVKNATQFPEGFITTAHYLKTSSYVQVTGFFDHTKYKLSDTDGGGQYDTHHGGKPIGAKCLGYNYFVSVIEPDINRFCIRCCLNTEDCPTGRSGYGCLRVIDGDYTNDNNMINGTDSTDTDTTESNLSNTHENSVYNELDFLVAHKNAAPSQAGTSADDDDEEDDDDTDSSSNDKIAQEIESLKNDSYSASEIKEKWNAFSQQLSANYPHASEQVDDLNTVASSLTTTDQWKAFFELVSDKIIQFQEDSDDNATLTDDTKASSTDTHTNEDLDWLFEHRRSHDNQATW